MGELSLIEMANAEKEVNYLKKGIKSYSRTSAIVMTVFMLSPLFLFGQEADSCKAFYPLHLGDLWMYEDQTAREIETHQIIGDTLINNRLFHVFKVTWANNFAPDRRFFRTLSDSLWVLEYLQDPNDGIWKEVIIYKLNARVGESWEVLPGFPTSLDSIGQIHLLDADWDTKYFGVFNGFFTHQEVLAESLGFVARFGQGEISTTILQGAIIGGKVFGNVTDVRELPRNSNHEFQLFQNYPNPFNANTVVLFQIAQYERIDLAVYNIKGELVRRLVFAMMPPGKHEINWNGMDSKDNPVTTGVYFIRLITQSGRFSSKKVVLVK